MNRDCIDMNSAANNRGCINYALMHENFATLCDFGGRLLGSIGEREAVEWAGEQLAEIGGEFCCFPIDLTLWTATCSHLTLVDCAETFACQPMLGTLPTPANGLIAPVLNLGRGHAEDYLNAGDVVRGKIILVEHEYPFSSEHFHRREKIRAAIRSGATGFLMRNPEEDRGMLSGSASWVEGFEPIPCAFVSAECAARLQSSNGTRMVQLVLPGEAFEIRSGSPSLLIGDPTLPRIVLSAHIDGHPLGESALDNATGVAVALEATRRMAPIFSQGCRYALQTVLFTAEEWALAGSRQYLSNLSEEALRKIFLNINLDTVAGSSSLTALIGNFTQLDALVKKASLMSNIDVKTHWPLLANSDHYNFARLGIPAFRLIAGFDEPESRVRHILSSGDKRDKVMAVELNRALEFVCTLIGIVVSEAEALDVPGKIG